MPTPTEIRKGRVLDYEGTPHLVLDAQQRAMGRQAGFVQAVLRNLRTGASSTVKFRTTETVFFCTTETQELEFSYVDAEGYHFMNPTTFEDVILPANVVDLQKDYIVPNHIYDVLFVNDRAVEIQLPGAVELKVIETSEGVRGDSANAPTKPAKTETGLVVQVPLFVKLGEVIRVGTGDGSYLSRA
jgi:elongation factor P